MCADSSCRTLRRPFSRALPRLLTIRGGIGSDAAGGFMDLSKLVSGGGKLEGAFGDLAYKIGKTRAALETLKPHIH